uniref:AAA family ATPase n=1 Tax=Candidatus Electronema sp. TaxID=2698783 RepID=UPI0040578EF8
MLQSLYVHNFRCLENFELNVKGLPYSLLIGKNGSGKSTVSYALEIFQSIARGTNRVKLLVKENDFSRGRSDVPVRFSIEAVLEEKLYKYELALELPENFKELRVAEEQLSISGSPIYSRKQAEVTLHGKAKFSVDWHIVALPIIQEQSESDPLRIFKTWLSHMIILSPVPIMMTGESNGETLQPERRGANFGEWISGLFSRYPAAYMQVDKYLRKVMPDLQDVFNESVGKDSKNMIVRFEANKAALSVDFKLLSDAEKCFFICAAVLAANKSYGPLLCFWDEPDNYLALAEIQHFIVDLKRSFQESGQILMTSHNSEGIRSIPHENIFVLDRKSHLEPTQIKRLDELNIKGDLIESLISGDIEL